MAGWQVRIGYGSDREKEEIVGAFMAIVPGAQATELGPQSSYVQLPVGFALLVSSSDNLTFQITSLDAKMIAEKMKARFPAAEISEIERSQPNPQL